MQTIESALRKEMRQLEKIIEDAKVRLKTAPKGHLRIIKKRGGIEYYYKSDNNSSIVNQGNGSSGKNSSNNGRYMRKSEKNLARGIAQRDHDLHVIVVRQIK